MNKNQNTTEFVNRSITYAEAETDYVTEITENKASNQEIKNVRSALKSWREMLNLNVNSQIEDEFACEFEKNIATYIHRQKQLNIMSSTYKSRICRIKKFRNFYLNFSHIKLLRADFAERLKFLLKKNGFSATKFTQTYLKSQLSTETLRSWCNKLSLPQSSSINIVEKIETVLNIPANTLVSTLPMRKKTDNLQVNRSKFGKKIQWALKHKYSVWTKNLEDEYQDLTEFKSCTVLPQGLKRQENAVWTFSCNRLPSAEIAKSQFKLFFGYCCLSKNSSDRAYQGLGMSKENLSLALLTNKEILESYLLIFKKDRTENTFNFGFIAFIRTILCLLRKNTGYLYQKTELAKKAGLNLSTAQWQKRCLDTHKRLKEIMQSIEQAKRSGSNQFSFGRDPREAIQEILEKKNPLLILLKMTKDMLEDVEKLLPNSIEKAILYRDILLISLLLANPLRIKMFKIMKLNENLIKDKDGIWWLCFKRNDFKNRKSIKKDYKVKVSTSIQYIIERYINEFRAQILNGEKSEMVFVKKTVKNGKTPNASLLTSSISGIVFKRTKQYIENCVGFGPHAFRHIVATSIIKKDPRQGFYLAAIVLHDKIQTVQSAYAHLKTSEMFEPYNDFLAENFANAGFKSTNLSLFT